MGKIILILGGARSGKSAYAIELAKKHKKVAFIATCQVLDREMARRIEMHQKVRPKHWRTFEEPKDLSPLLNKISPDFDCIIVDCLTLLVSNLVLAGFKEKEILKQIEAMLVSLKKTKAKVIMVSNEVGLGLVPPSKLGRDFRDIAGRVNQMVAQQAGQVFFMAAGLSLKIK